MPGLLPEAAAFFNTPLEELDPAILPFMLRAFATKVAELLPPETGLADADALFADLRARFAGLLDKPAPDAAPSEAPATPADLNPHAQRASPAAPPPPSPPEASPPVLLSLPLPEVSKPVLHSSPPPPPEARAPQPPHAAATTVAAAPPCAPDAASVSPDHPQSDASLLRYSTKNLYHRCRWLLQACRAALRRFLVRTCALRHWCYAARASPD
jgi:hypothetical protein